jgi:hypothetical protein
LVVFCPEFWFWFLSFGFLSLFVRGSFGYRHNNNVGEFLWKEIKNSSENPQRLCSYGPYISYIIKKVTQRAYPNDTKHRPLQPKPSRTIRVPSPQDGQQEEQEIFEEREAPRSWEAYQPGGNSTAPQGWFAN